MKDLKYIKKFIFAFAEYYLSDGEGDKVILKVDYKKNDYLVEYTGKTINQNFRSEVNQIAQTLLKRKSGVNRAKTIKL